MKFLLQNRNLNQQDEDGITYPSYKTPGSDIRKEQGWQFFQNPSSKCISSPIKISHSGYSLPSPLEDMSDQATSLSSPEELSRNGNIEEDILSDLEYTETSPLLTKKNFKKILEKKDEEDYNEDFSEDFNNNHYNSDSIIEGDSESLDSEDSLFSDSSDMSDQVGKRCYVRKNIYNNNNNNNNNAREHSYLGSEKLDMSTRFCTENSDESKLNPKCNIHYSAQSESPIVSCQKGNNLPDVLPLDATKSPNLASDLTANDVSPMSDTSCSSDLDINIASNQEFNNFSKHNGIKCLVQDTMQPKEINIRDFDSEALPSSSLDESKILNTLDQLPRNMTKEYQYQLSNTYSWNETEEWPRIRTIENTEKDFEKTNIMVKHFLDNQTKKLTEQFEHQEDNKLLETKESSVKTTGCSERSTEKAEHVGEQVDLLSRTKNANEISVPHAYTSGDENHNSKNNRSFSLTPEDNNAVELTVTTAKRSSDQLGDFDVYNIETAMPTIDWVAMEAHLTRAAKEDDWLKRRKNDREEIRRKLAMDSDSEDYYLGERMTKKPSLTTRLQNGMNLQICFMNETANDQENQNIDNSAENESEENSSLLLSDKETKPEEEREQQKVSATTPLVPSNTNLNNNNNNEVLIESGFSPNTKNQRPSFFFNRQRSWRLSYLRSFKYDRKEDNRETGEDFFKCHARLQAEARMALDQAKDMARMQMEVERQRKKKSPIAEIVGLPFPNNKHTLSRHVLIGMNVAQLQVIVNDLHSQIEGLNEELVRLLLERDDLHMEQDSMLVDIEDITRYLGAKDEALKKQHNTQLKSLKSTKT